MILFGIFFSLFFSHSADIITAWKSLQHSIFTIELDIELPKVIKLHFAWKTISVCLTFSRVMLAQISVIKVILLLF